MFISDRSQKKMHRVMAGPSCFRGADYRNCSTYKTMHFSAHCEGRWGLDASRATRHLSQTYSAQVPIPYAAIRCLFRNLVCSHGPRDDVLLVLVQCLKSMPGRCKVHKILAGDNCELPNYHKGGAVRATVQQDQDEWDAHCSCLVGGDKHGL